MDSGRPSLRLVALAVATIASAVGGLGAPAVATEPGGKSVAKGLIEDLRPPASVGIAEKRSLRVSVIDTLGMSWQPQAGSVQQLDLVELPQSPNDPQPLSVDHPTVDSKHLPWTSAQPIPPTGQYESLPLFAEREVTEPLARATPSTVATVAPDDHAADDDWRRLPPELPRAVQLRIESMIQEGINLAERGAYYSARAAFKKALWTTSQSLDAEDGSRRFSRALAHGLQALQEARDFQPRGSSAESVLNMEATIATHRTPILKGVDYRRLSVWTALQQYHAYAERELGKSGGGQRVAADAMFGLARIEPMLNVGRDVNDTTAGPLSMSYYQAALQVDPSHELAGNELAVMLAKYGQLTEARAVLRRTVASSTSEATTWTNLASVHEALGEYRLADLARRESENRQAAVADQPTGNSTQVKWVSPEEFAAGHPSQLDAARIPPASTPGHATFTAARPERPTRSDRDDFRAPVRPSQSATPMSLGQRYGSH